MSKLGLIAVHGMGTTSKNFADAFFQDIKDRLTKNQKGRLKTGTVYYQDILQPNEKAYYDKVKSKLDWRKLRQFVLYGFCDAASLETQKIGKNSPYFQAQTKIFDALLQMQKTLDKNAPIIVVAQSLGGQVISNYLWDALLPKGATHGVWSKPPKLPKEVEKVCRGRTIQRLYTTGCNIPIFVAGRPAKDIKSISKPHPKFRWENFYDKDDVLGWPLKELSASYKSLVNDHRINAGFFSSLTPLSHVNYWRDSEFLNPLVQDIKTVI